MRATASCWSGSGARVTTTPDRPRVALALVHFPVIRDRLGSVGATSVTPLNVHDLARAARTYGVAPLYVVTPLLSQQALVGRILNHYREGYGAGANPTRAEALRQTLRKRPDLLAGADLGAEDLKLLDHIRGTDDDGA